MHGGSRIRFLSIGFCLCLATSACAVQAAAGTVRAAAAPREPAVFYGTWGANLPGVAAYSASTGRRLKILVPHEPGGGVLQLALAPRDRTIAFTAGNGTCGTVIESVASTGGPVHVLVAEGRQHGGTPASSPSYSADGRYFSYVTSYCDTQATFLHIRDLRTGKTRTRRISLTPFGLVFLRGDRVAVAAAGPAGLTAVSLPSLAARSYRAPSGCSYDQVAGTESRLIAALDCGRRHQLSVVSLSTRTFRVTGTVARLGSCLRADSLSLSGGGAVLAEAVRGCNVRPTAIPRAEVVAIRGGHARTVLAGKITALPGDVVW
jgi:hypothetical protein